MVLEATAVVAEVEVTVVAEVEVTAVVVEVEETAVVVEAAETGAAAVMEIVAAEAEAARSHCPSERAVEAPVAEVAVAAAVPRGLQREYTRKFS